MRRLLALTALVCAGVACVGVGTAGAALPDNRGWEIVTPRDQTDDIIPSFWSSDNGDMTVFKSLHSFAEGPANGGAAGYLARRGAGAWTSQTLMPAGSGIGDPENPALSPITVKGNGSRTIWAGLYSDIAQSRDVFLGTGPGALVNISKSVRPAGGSALYAGSSANADHIAFGVYPTFGETTAAQLYDYTNGSPQPVGILPDQTTPDPGGAVLGSFESNYGSGSAFHAVSSDGSRLFFESPAPQPAPGGFIPEPSGLYVRESGVATKQIDPSAIYWDATSDGSTVLYSPGKLNGEEREVGLSTYDLAREQATEIAPASAYVQGIGGVSDDLSRIYFVALGDLAHGATEGEPNLYLYDRNSQTPIRFVANVNFSGAIVPTVQEAARFSAKDGYNESAVTSMASADGRLLEFISTRRLTDYDNQGQKEIYLFDADAAQNPLVCISCSPDGAPPLGESWLSRRAYNTTAPQVSGEPSQMVNEPTNISVDNRRVFFETLNALDPRDQNGVADVYEWENGAAHLISSGTENESRFSNATPSGDDVFFVTRNELTWQADTSNLQVIYDARVNGGFPAPPTPGAPCDQGGTCQGPPAPPPAVGATGSASFRGAGNLPPEKRTKEPTFKVATLGSKARAQLASGKRATMKVTVGAAGQVTTVMSAKIGKQVRTIARASRTANRAGTVQLSLRLSKAALRELQSGHRLRVRTAVRFSKANTPKHSSFTLTGAGQKGSH